MNRFELWFSWLMGMEGGYSNDPQDPGGETNFGISKRAYPNLDIKAITQADAKAIALRDFWIAMRCEEMPIGVDIQLADCGFNQGQPAAVQLLQQAAGLRGTAVDGVVGPGTMSAIAAIHPDDLAVEFASRRGGRYAMNKNYYLYGLGWTRRLMKCFRLATRGT